MSLCCDTYTPHAFKKDVCASCFLAKSGHAEFGGSGEVEAKPVETSAETKKSHRISMTGGSGLARAASSLSKDKIAEFQDLCNLKFKEQAQWFLNGFWTDLEPEAEFIWDVVQKCVELEDQKRAEGTALDEFHSHRLLEVFDNSMTVVSMREALKAIDVTKDNTMSVLEYLCWRFEKGVDETVDSPQGDNEAEIHAAQEKIAQVQALLAECAEKLESAQEALAVVRAEEATLTAAQAELQAAIDELNAQEAAYEAKKEALSIKKEDESLGVVTRNKAANELEQLLAEDPLPLRKAKITQEAALRRVTKQKKIVEAAREEAEKKEAELQESYDHLADKMAEAEEELKTIKLKGGGLAYGNLWWMERELIEADKYLPPNKRRNRN